MPSSPLDSTNGRTTSCVACYHRLWTRSHSWMASVLAYHHHPLMKNAVKRRLAWHAIIAFWQHTRSNDVARGITSTPFDNTYGLTTSGVACHHRLWATQSIERRPPWHAIITVGLAHTVRRRRVWHAINALGRQIRTNDVGRGMPSLPLGNTHSITT